MVDRDIWEERLGVEPQCTDSTRAAFWNVDDVLRPIYQEASDHFGREFPYPSGESTQ